MDQDEKRARNEALFREVNERIEKITTELGGDGAETSGIGFVCECGSTRCTEMVEATLGKYENVRSNPKRFLVVPGHEHIDTARVIERNRRFSVVEKVEDAGEVALKQDPRS